MCFCIFGEVLLVEAQAVIFFFRRNTMCFSLFRKHSCASHTSTCCAPHGKAWLKKKDFFSHQNLGKTKKKPKPKRKSLKNACKKNPDGTLVRDIWRRLGALSRPQKRPLWEPPKGCPLDSCSQRNTCCCCCGELKWVEPMYSVSTKLLWENFPLEDKNLNLV